MDAERGEFFELMASLFQCRGIKVKKQQNEIGTNQWSEIL